MAISIPLAPHHAPQQLRWTAVTAVTAVLQQHGRSQHATAFLHVAHGLRRLSPGDPRAGREQGLPGACGRRGLAETTEIGLEPEINVGVDPKNVGLM